MTKAEAIEKLFKSVYGAMIDVDNQELTKDEIAVTVLKTVNHFIVNE